LTLDLELVRERPASRDRALGDPRRSVHPRGTVLEETVPVDAGADLGELVFDVDDDGVPFVCLDSRTRILSYEYVYGVSRERRTA
jgi:hypothetical protein